MSQIPLRHGQQPIRNAEQLQQPNIPSMTRAPSRDDEIMRSYKEMLTVVRRLYELYGDPSVGEVVVRADRALASR